MKPYYLKKKASNVVMKKEKVFLAQQIFSHKSRSINETFYDLEFEP